jgi:hypothetical protein
MPTALICSQADLELELGQTLLWRRDFERHSVGGLEEALMLALAARPAVVLVDRDLPRSAKLVAKLRADPATRGLSIAVLARGDFDPGEIELLEAGANAILRIPPGPDWDDRLTPLLQVPIRKDIRIAVQFDVEASARGPAVPALALNLSAHGMLMESHVALAVGDELSVTFLLPGDAVPVTCGARVVRQAAATQYGVGFLAFDREDKGRVDRFVSSAKAS